MEAQHIQPDLCTYVILLDGMCQNQEISDVFSFLRTVEDKGVIPDIITYAILINGFCKVGKLDDASDVFNQLLPKACDPMLKYITPLLAHFTKKGLMRRQYVCLMRWKRMVVRLMF